MERTQLFDLMGELKLYGMKACSTRSWRPLSNASTNLNALLAICSTQRSTRSRPARSSTSLIAKLPLAKDLEDSVSRHTHQPDAGQRSRRRRLHRPAT